MKGHPLSMGMSQMNPETESATIDPAIVPVSKKMQLIMQTL